MRHGFEIYILSVIRGVRRNAVFRGLTRFRPKGSFAGFERAVIPSRARSFVKRTILRSRPACGGQLISCDCAFDERGQAI